VGWQLCPADGRLWTADDCHLRGLVARADADLLARGDVDTISIARAIDDQVATPLRGFTCRVFDSQGVKIEATFDRFALVVTQRPIQGGDRERAAVIEHYTALVSHD